MDAGCWMKAKAFASSRMICLKERIGSCYHRTVPQLLQIVSHKVEQEYQPTGAILPRLDLVVQLQVPKLLHPVTSRHALRQSPISTSTTWLSPLSVLTMLRFSQIYLIWTAMSSSQVLHQAQVRAVRLARDPSVLLLYVHQAKSLQ